MKNENECHGPRANIYFYLLFYNSMSYAAIVYDEAIA